MPTVPGCSADGRREGRNMEVYLGIDLGTSCIKAAFLSSDGDIVGLGSADVSLSLPQPGFAEQDPEE